MKIVSPTGSAVSRNGGIYRVLEMLSQAGFDGADLGMTNLKELCHTDNAAYRREVARAVKDTGIEIRQAHAPFPGRRYGDEEYDKIYDPAVRLSIETAADLGAHTVVVHPIYCPTLTAAEQMEWNLEYYNALAPLARSAGIRIALENMYRGGMPDRFYPNVCSLPDEFARYFDALDPKVFTCCLDIGHFAMMSYSPAKAILEMGHHRVGALHIHDNDMIHDQHNPPYMGQINWEEVTKALADIRYEGDFTFETKIAISLPPELFLSAQRMMADMGRYLVGRIEYYQNEQKS